MTNKPTRLRLNTASCSRERQWRRRLSGYAKYATALSAFLEQEYPGKVAVSQGVYGDGACKTGAFEVTAGTTLIHSKLTMGHGKCQTDEELDAVLEKVEALLPKAE